MSANGRCTPVLCLGACLTALLLTACAAARPQPSAAAPPAGPSDLQVQAIVMEMADDYIAALGETIYLMPEEVRGNPRMRWLSQSFLRNGVGAAVDIASGPNPNVAVLDLVVLASLQAWAFDRRWTAEGLAGEAAEIAADRMREAERRTWDSAGRVLGEEERASLRELIDDWIEANPDQLVVSLVRFDDFTEARMAGGPATHKKASGLLSQVRGATAAVEDARLFGERLLWFAGRYPYILGEQAELTAYRLADQPETRALVQALEEATATGREIGAALQQAEPSLDHVASAAVDRTFDRLAGERAALLDELENRHDALQSVLAELGRALQASTTLAGELGGTVGALDRLAERFDPDPASGRKPIDLGELRGTLVEANRALELLTAVMDRTDGALGSDAWNDRLGAVDGLTNGLVDRAYHRGLTLVLILLAGLALIRLIPSRSRVRASGPG